MIFAVGDIIRCFAPIAGHYKFHLLISVGTECDAYKFLFINSDSNFADTYSVDCARMPMIAPSKTGKSAFSFTMVPRYNNEHLKIYNATKIGELPTDIAAELLQFVDGVRALTRGDKAQVKEALIQICEKNLRQTDENSDLD